MEYCLTYKGKVHKLEGRPIYFFFAVGIEAKVQEKISSYQAKSLHAITTNSVYMSKTLLNLVYFSCDNIIHSP